MDDLTNIDEFENMRKFNILQTKCKKYIEGKKYVFVLCRDILGEDTRKKWLVVMEKIDEYKMRVVKIININDPELIKKHIVDGREDYTEHNDEYMVRDIKYVVGKIISTNYYFKDMIVAYYDREMPNNYTGRWFVFGHKGTIFSDKHYINGKEVERVWTSENDDINDNYSNRKKSGFNSRQNIKKYGFNKKY